MVAMDATTEVGISCLGARVCEAGLEGDDDCDLGE